MDGVLGVYPSISVFKYDGVTEYSWKSPRGDYLAVDIPDSGDYTIVLKTESKDGWDKTIEYANILDLEEVLDKFMSKGITP